MDNWRYLTVIAMGRAALLFLCLWAIPAWAALDWEPDLDEALARATESEQPLLVAFHAKWCHYCKLMAETTLRDDAVRRELEMLETAAIDFDAHPQVATRYEVHALPTYLLLDGEGRVLKRLKGYADAAAFQTWLTSEPQAENIQAAAKPLTREALAERYETADSAARETLLEEVMAAVAADREGSNPARQAFLRTVAEDDRELLWPFLDHERLALRIAAVNALQAAHGESDYDPWAPRSERQEAAARWAEALQQ